jgi:hypothetical protein
VTDLTLGALLTIVCTLAAAAISAFAASVVLTLKDRNRGAMTFGGPFLTGVVAVLIGYQCVLLLNLSVTGTIELSRRQMQAVTAISWQTPLYLLIASGLVLVVQIVSHRKRN